MASVKQRDNNRGVALLDAAAVLFADQGYHRTTIRDVTSAVGMGPGSSYYHFASKAEMLLAVYNEGVKRVSAAVEAGLDAGGTDPWSRLDAAVVGHVEAVLAPTAYARVIVAVLPDDVPEIQADLRRARQGYELLWRQLIDDLGVDTDAGLLRLFLLGAANSTQVWYRPGGSSPAEIGAAFVSFLRQPLEQQ